jgi:hypothetical protein
VLSEGGGGGGGGGESAIHTSTVHARQTVWVKCVAMLISACRREFFEGSKYNFKTTSRAGFTVRVASDVVFKWQ